MNKSQAFLNLRKEHFKSLDIKQKEKLEKFITKFLAKKDFNVLEMYQYEGDVIKNSERIPQYLKEYIYCNTRTKLLSETRAEIDTLPFEKSVDVICKICLELLKFDFHFAVFYAKGQRSPHIIIYDFYELESLKPHQREKAQLEFWRSLIPFQVNYLDKSIWFDDHYVPLEFAPHWKYGTPFNLLFEYIPGGIKCKV